MGNAENVTWRELKEKIKAIRDAKCPCCGALGKLDLHHIEPRQNKGKDTEDNLQLLCRPCHAQTPSLLSEVTMMESPMTRNCHVGFGERYEETHQSQDWEVRFVPTPFSPLLANIGLHGLETTVKSFNNKLGIIRYADDFIISSKTKRELEEVVPIVKQWLLERGLEFSAEKTKLVHIDEGFNFLGFNARHYNGKLLIKPQN